MEKKEENSNPKKSSPKGETGPDFKIKKIDDESEKESPKVFKIARQGKKNSPKDRRDFLRNAAAGMSGLLGLSSILSSCERSDIDLHIKNNDCTCHAVCTCDTVAENERADWVKELNGTICSCDLVCACNTVCTCNSQGGGGTYYYPN